MARKRLEQEFPLNRRTVIDDVWLKRLLQVLEARISGIENKAVDYDTATRTLLSLGLQRISEVLLPALDRVQELTSLGFLIANSSTPNTLVEGATLMFVLPEGVQRDLFSPSIFTALTRADNPNDWAILRTQGYDAEHGEYFAKVESFAGDPGPHSDWIISGLAGSTIAGIDLLAETKAERTAAKGEMDAGLATIAGVVDEVNEDRQAVTELAVISEDAAALANQRATDAGVYLSQFTSRWLGALAADPAVDGAGNPVTEGAAYLNTTVDPASIRIYRDGEWGNFSSPAASITFAFAGDGTTGPYTLPAVPPTPSAILVFVDGIFQTGFTVDGNQLTMGTAISPAEQISGVILETLEVAVPAPESVGADQIAESEVEAIKEKLGGSRVSIEAAIKEWKASTINSRKFWAGTNTQLGAGSISGGALAAGRTFISATPAHASRQDGLIRTILVNMLSAGLDANRTESIRFKVFRPNGASYDFIDQTELLTPRMAGFNTFELATPLLVRPGDHIGVWIKGAADALTNSKAEIECAQDGGLVRYVEGDLTSAPGAMTDIANLSMLIECRGTRPFLACLGEGTMEGHNGALNWHSFYHDGPAGNPLSEPLNMVRELIPELEYQNYAQTSTKWADHLAKLDALERNAAPRAVIIGAGGNDISSGTTWASVLASMDAIKAKLPVGTKLFLTEILPIPSFSDAQSATIRDWNSRFAAWCAKNDAELILCHDAMGKIRATTGQLDDLADGYEYAGASLTYEGVAAYAELIAAGLKKANWLQPMPKGWTVL